MVVVCVKFREKLRTVICGILSICIIVFASFCVFERVAQNEDFYDSTALMAALTIMPNGSLEADQTEGKISQQKPKSNVTQTMKTESITDTSVKSDEQTYKISEVNLGGEGTSYGNISIKNSTSYDMDVESLLESPLSFELKDSRQVQVLIVHTHTCESYMTEDNGYYYESFYPRTTDNSSNVTAVGEAISNSLKVHGIGVVHAVTQHDNPSYDGAYDRSYDTIMQYMEKYPEIKVVLDIHRDSMTQDDITKLKPTFTYNGQKAAQIMIMTGHDDGDGEFPMWEDNLIFALKLQQTCEDMYEGMTRPLNFGDFTYNMNVNSGSLLIEVGTDANTLQEAVRTGEMLGNALSQVLQKS